MTAGGLWRARGPRAAEDLVVREVLSLAARAREDPRLLARPVRVVVPSRMLRDHLLRRLMENAGVGIAGVVVQTHRAVASEILERVGLRPTTPELLAPLVLRQCVEAEPGLAALLAAYRDGLGAALPSVTDFLDAGIRPEDAEPLEECVASAEGLEGLAGELAKDLVRAAARAAGELDRLDVGHGARLLRLAREALQRDPEGAYPSRAVYVYGFADATGLTLDLLEALLRAFPGGLVLDLPPDPARPGGPPPHEVVAFARPLLDRMSGFLAEADPSFGAAEPEVTPPDILEAPDGLAEARTVAQRIARLLEEGTPPESVAVVARSPDVLFRDLPRELAELGIPFSSGPGAGVSLPFLAAPLRGLAALLRGGGQVAADRWLDAAFGSRWLAECAAAAGLHPERVQAELRLGLHALGAGRLSSVAGLQPERVLRDGELLLPFRAALAAVAGSEEAEAGGADAAASAEPSRLPGGVLRSAVSAAARLVEILEGWPEERRDAAEQADRLESLLEELGVDRAFPEVVGDIRTALRADRAPTVSRAEIALLADAAADTRSGPPSRGAGGGVQLLGAMEARGVTAEHLFLVGLHRGAFPRLAQEDPLLPDAARRSLRQVLPDLPVKERAADEDRYLFAQLAAAAPRLTLSWASTDEEGRTRAPSPLLQQMQHGRGLEPEEGPAADARLRSPGRAPGGSSLRPARQWARAAAAHGARRIYRTAHREALVSSARGGGFDLPPCQLAEARMDVLRRHARAAPGAPAGLTPYLGLVGPLRADGDPRRRALSVTVLEALHACPWQAFLTRILRLEPSPDAFDALDAMGPSFVGRVVHGALERLAAAAGAPTRHPLPAAMAADPVELAPPPDGARQRALRAAAEDVLKEDGLVLPGLAACLAARARPLLDRALVEPATVLGAELEGEAFVERPGGGRPVRIGFRADRAEHRPEGVVLVDFKTGKPLSTAVKESTRRQALAKAVRRGEALQAAIYARSGGTEPGSVRAGEFWYLGAEEGAADRFRVEADDLELRAALETAVSEAVEAVERGILPPLAWIDSGDSTGEERGRCSRCGVREACIRGRWGPARLLESIAGRRRRKSDLSALGAVLAAREGTRT